MEGCYFFMINYLYESGMFTCYEIYYTCICIHVNLVILNAEIVSIEVVFANATTHDLHCLYVHVHCTLYIKMLILILPQNDHLIDYFNSVLGIYLAVLTAECICEHTTYSNMRD